MSRKKRTEVLEFMTRARVLRLSRNTRIGSFDWNENRDITWTFIYMPLISVRDNKILYVYS